MKAVVDCFGVDGSFGTYVMHTTPYAITTTRLDSSMWNYQVAVNPGWDYRPALGLAISAMRCWPLPRGFRIVEWL